MKKALLLSIFILSIIASANAQWTTDSTMNTMVRDTNGLLSPLMASISNGSTYVVWYEFNGSNLELHMQLLDHDGYKQWAPGGIVVSNYPQTTSTYRYDLKVDNEGNAIVAFQDTRSAGNLNIVAYKIDQQGNSIWGAAGVALTDPSSTEGLSPSICVTKRNDVYIAWAADSSNTKKWIACQRLSPAGVILWNNYYRVRDYVGNLKYSRPQLLPAGDNNMQMLFVQETGSFPGVTSTLYAQRVDSSGSNIWLAPVMISTKTIPYFVFPIPVADDSDGFYVAFDSSNPLSLSLNDVYAQHIDSSGNLWSPTGTEAANSSVNAKTMGASCFVHSSGEFWVALHYQDGGQGNSGVNVQKFDATGHVLLGPDGTVVIPTDPINYIPSTINDALNGVIITATYGPYGNVHVIAEKLDYSGMPAWANINVSLCAVHSNKDDVQSGKFINNNLVIVWQDDRTSSGAFAQNISGDGDLGIINGVATIIDNDHSVLFPNPSEAPLIIFSDSKKSDKLIIITDLSGRQVATINVPSSARTVSFDDYKDLSDGLYFISIRGTDNVETFKWVKDN